jgi:O-antigen ligase
MAYIVVAFRSIPARLRQSAVVLGIVVLTVFGSSTYWNMMSTILHPAKDYNMTADAGRKAIWKRGIGYMFARPVLGVGASAFEQAEGTFSSISRQYASENRGLKWSAAHNSFVQVGAELGVGGLILFVVMIGTSLSHLARIRPLTDTDPFIGPADAAFAQTLTASLIGFCVAGFFVSAAFFSLLYALIGFVVAEDSFSIRRRGRNATPAAQDVRRPAARAVRAYARTTHWSPANAQPLDHA